MSGRCDSCDRTQRVLCYACSGRDELKHENAALRAEVKALRERASDALNILRRNGLYDSPAYREIAALSSPQEAPATVEPCKHEVTQRNLGNILECMGCRVLLHDAPATRAGEAGATETRKPPCHKHLYDFDKCDSRCTYWRNPPATVSIQPVRPTTAEAPPAVKERFCEHGLTPDSCEACFFQTEEDLQRLNDDIDAQVAASTKPGEGEK